MPLSSGRLLLPALGALLALAPSALAGTTSQFSPPGDANALVLTNDGDGETFTVTLTYVSPGYVYKIEAVNGTIANPNVITCTGGGTKTLTCDQTQPIKYLKLALGAGNDTVDVNAANGYTSTSTGGLQVLGEAGDDTFTAVGASRLLSTIDGGADNDTFNGGPSSDSFRAEPGNDTYTGGTQPVADPPFPGQDPATYQLVYGSDTWSAAGDEPVTVSLDGVANDADGQGGTDNVKADVEYVNGGGGADHLTAGTEPASLTGNDGDDTLVGSPQADSLYGEAGNDTLTGNGGDDGLYDGDYDREYRLNTDPVIPAGNDTLDGGDGDDAFVVGGGKDDVIGGAGTDSLDYGRILTQSFDAYPPETQLRTQYRGMTVSLDDQPNDGPTGANEGDNVHADVEDVDTAAIDSGIKLLYRSARLVDLYDNGAIADDVVTGAAAANVIATGGGKDTVDGGAGADTIDVGRGDDSVTAADRATDLIACGAGTDTVVADLPGTNPDRADSLTHCETVSGTALGLEGGTLPTAPKVTLGGAAKVKVKAFLKRTAVSVDVTSDQSATVTGELTTTRARITKVGALPIGTGALKAGTGTRTLKVKVARRYRKALKGKLRTKRQRRKGIKLALAVTVTNAAGQATTATRTIKVKG